MASPPSRSSPLPSQSWHARLPRNAQPAGQVTPLVWERSVRVRGCGEVAGGGDAPSLHDARIQLCLPARGGGLDDHLVGVLTVEVRPIIARPLVRDHLVPLRAARAALAV